MSNGNRDMAVFAALIALGLVAPLVIYPVFLMKVLCFALFACAFNLLVGYVGLLSFGHAMFFGFAAYVSGYAVKAWGWPTEVGILAGTAVAALMGLAAGLIAIRRQGIYFAMVTLALAQMVFFFCLQAKFTGGRTASRPSRAAHCWASSISATTSSSTTSSWRSLLPGSC